MAPLHLADETGQETNITRLPGSLAAGALVGLVVGVAATALVLSARGPGKAPGGASTESGAGQSARSGAGRGGFTPAVSIVAAQAASVGKTLDVIGEGRALKSVALTSEATGIVAEINIAPGRKVAKGDVLLRLDDEQQRIALERAKAQYPIAKQNAERRQASSYRCLRSRLSGRKRSPRTCRASNAAARRRFRRTSWKARGSAMP